jgi:outer membrane immunogenic protein
MRHYLLLAAAAAFTTSPAFAADLAGPRIEGRIAADKGTLDADVDDGFDNVSGSDSDKGLGLGAEAGFDAQFGGNFVAGAYVGADFFSTRFNGDDGELSSQVELTKNYYAGVRAGAGVGPALLYVKAGLSRGHFRLSIDDGIDSESASDDRNGYHFGAGAEVAISPKSYIKGEYTRTNYKAYSESDSEFGYTARLDAHRDQITAAVGFRF